MPAAQAAGDYLPFGNQLVTLPPRVDRWTARSVAADLMALCRKAGTIAVTLDLSQVTELDRAGLRALIVSRRRAAARGVRIVLREPSATATDVLGRAGILAGFDRDGTDSESPAALMTALDGPKGL